MKHQAVILDAIEALGGFIKTDETPPNEDGYYLDILNAGVSARDTLQALVDDVPGGLGEAMDILAIPNDHDENRDLWARKCEEYLSKWGYQVHHAFEDTAQILQSATTKEK